MKWLPGGEGSALEAAVHRSHLPADAGSAEVLCAPTATRLTLSPAAARTSCARTLKWSTASRLEQVVGSAGGTKYGYGKDGKPFLTKEPKLLLNDNNAGKPEAFTWRSAAVRTRPSATRPATDRCWSTPRPATARGFPCSSCMTTRARIRLRPCARAARYQGRQLPAGTLRRSEERRLGHYQHEGRLEAHFRFRPIAPSGPTIGICPGGARIETP